MKHNITINSSTHESNQNMNSQNPDAIAYLHQDLLQNLKIASKSNFNSFMIVKK
jgi:hypothetical protein